MLEGVNGGLPYSELGLYMLLNSESGAIILPISELWHTNVYWIDVNIVFNYVLL
jgi:hypothetical protein